MIKELRDIDVFEIALGRNPKNNKKFFVVKDGKEDKDKKEKEIKEKAVKDAKEKYVEAHNAALEAKKTLKDLDPNALDGLDEDAKKKKAEKDLAVKDATEKYEAAKKTLKDLDPEADPGTDADIKEQAIKDAKEKLSEAEKTLKDLDPEAIKKDTKDDSIIDPDLIKSAVKAFKDMTSRVETVEETVKSIVGVLKDATMMPDVKEGGDKKPSEKDDKSDSSAFFPYLNKKKEE